MEKEATELVISNELIELIPASKVELTKAQNYAVKFSPYMEKVHELSKALMLMNKENPSEIDVKTARINRLALVKVRTGSDGEKDTLKADLLIETKLIDGLNGVVKNSAALTESEYASIEKFAENRERERKDKLKNERLERLTEYTDQAQMYPLGEMSEDSFSDLLNGLKLAKEAKIEEERKAEEARLEKLRIEAEEKETLRLENERLQAEAKENERLAQVEKKKQADALAKIEAEKKAEQERHDKLIEAQRKEAEKSKAEADLKLKKEREENERLASELKAKKDAELAEKAKIEREHIERVAAEKKAAKAPDKDKLKAMVSSIQLPVPLTMSTNEGVRIQEEILTKLLGFKTWAEKQIEGM